MYLKIVTQKKTSFSANCLFKQMNLQTDNQSDEDGFEDGFALKMTSTLIQSLYGWRVSK